MSCDISIDNHFESKSEIRHNLKVNVRKIRYKNDDKLIETKELKENFSQPSDLKVERLNSALFRMTKKNLNKKNQIDDKNEKNKAQDPDSSCDLVYDSDEQHFDCKRHPYASSNHLTNSSCLLSHHFSQEARHLEINSQNFIDNEIIPKESEDRVKRNEIIKQRLNRLEQPGKLIFLK